MKTPASVYKSPNKERTRNPKRSLRADKDCPSPRSNGAAKTSTDDPQKEKIDNTTSNRLPESYYDTKFHRLDLNKIEHFHKQKKLYQFIHGFREEVMPNSATYRNIENDMSTQNWHMHGDSDDNLSVTETHNNSSINSSQTAKPFEKNVSQCGGDITTFTSYPTRQGEIPPNQVSTPYSVLRATSRSNPPMGYFVRDDFSDDSSFFDSKASWILKGVENRTSDSDTLAASHLSSSHLSSCAQETKNPIDPNKLLTKKCKTLKSVTEKGPLCKDRSAQITKNKHENTQNMQCKRKLARVDEGIENHNNTPSAKPCRLLRYQQKVLSTKNRLTRNAMFSLPVTRDSPIYYYEPQSKTIKKLKINNSKKCQEGVEVLGINQLVNTNQSALETGAWNPKLKNLVYSDSSNADGPRWGVVRLNVNANSNTDDVDLVDLGDTKHKETYSSMSCTSAVSGDTFFSTKTDSVSNEYNDTRDNESTVDLTRRNGLVMNVDNLDFMVQQSHPPQDQSDRQSVDESSLDCVVDDLIQNVKEEVEVERTQLHGDPEGADFKVNGQKKKPMTKPESSSFDSSSKKTKRSSAAEAKEQVISQIMSQNGGKSSARFDSPRKALDSRIVNHSSPTISASVKISHAMLGRKGSISADRWDSSRRSPYTLSPRQDDLSGREFIDQSSITTFNEQSLCDGNETENETDVQQKEINKSKLSCRKGMAFSSPQRPKQSSSKERGERYTAKRMKKRKSSLDIKKSSSASPTPASQRKPKAQSGGRSSPERHNKKELKRKKSSPVTSGKKKMKKVRIAVNESWCPTNTGGENDEEDRKNMSIYSDVSDKMLCNNEGRKEGEAENDFEEDEVYEEEEDEEEGAYDDVDDEEEDQEEHEAEEGSDHEGKVKGRVGIFSPPSSAHKTTKSKKSKTKTPCKAKKPEKPEEKTKSQAEQGWNLNYKNQTVDPKAKKVIIIKKKRYQLKKTSPKLIRTDTADGKMGEHAQREEEDIEKLCPSTDLDMAAKKANIHAGKREGLKKLASGKRQSYSPKPLRKRIPDQCKVPSPVAKASTMKDPSEGSSVDAPGFGKKESSLRYTKSGSAVCIGKQNTRENLEINAAKRVRQARESFSKFGRKVNSQNSPVKEGHSPLRERVPSVGEQSCPVVCRSTDLDLVVVESKRHQQQSSPLRAVGSARLTRRESKVGSSVSKVRSKSESDESKARLKIEPEDVVKGKSPIRRTPMPQLTDPMDMNVLNLGLSWVVQGLIKRIPYFKSQYDEAPLSSAAADVETVEVAVQ